jgi:hypothetical protein
MGSIPCYQWTNNGEACWAATKVRNQGLLGCLGRARLHFRLLHRKRENDVLREGLLYNHPRLLVPVRWINH